MAKQTRNTRAKFIRDTIQSFREHNPDWKPEHGRNELRNVLNYMLDAELVQPDMLPGEASAELAAYISGPF